MPVQYGVARIRRDRRATAPGAGPPRAAGVRASGLEFGEPRERPLDFVLTVARQHRLPEHTEEPIEKGRVR